MDLVFGLPELLQHSLGLVHAQTVAKEDTKREGGTDGVWTVVVDAFVEEIILLHLLLESVDVFALCRDAHEQAVSNVALYRRDGV